MSRSNPFPLLIILAVVAAAAMVVIVATSAGNQAVAVSSGPLQLVNTYDQSPSAFSFQYPEDWQYQIPQQGLLILGTPTSIAGQPGPTLTIQRSIALTGEGTLRDALEAYLAQGPLRPNREWQQLGEIVGTTLSGREALTADFQGSERPNETQLRIHIVATRAANRIVYIFVTSAPLADWDKHSPTLDAVLASVNIIE